MRTILNHATLTDYLLTAGTEFDPDTVVIDATALANSNYGYVKDARCVPPFACQNIEFFVHPGDDIRQLMTVFALPDRFHESYGTRMPGLHWLYAYAHLSLHLPTQRLVGVDALTLCGFDVDGRWINHGALLTPPLPMQGLPDSLHPETLHFSDEAWEAALNIANATFAYMHAERDVVLVEPTRQRRRHIERKTGKAPSPYFLLPVSGAPRRDYSGTAGDGTEGQGPKKRMHLVRGHFRHLVGHPRIPDGTYFIRAHMRGGVKGGRVQKGYRIVMPKEKVDES